MTELPSEHNIQKKNEVLRIIEPILLCLCLCVISLRATLTEAPNIVSNNLPGGSLDGIYSLTVSTLLLFSALVWLICNLLSRKITYRYCGIETGLVIFVIAALFSIFAASNRRAAITDAATLTAPIFMAVMGYFIAFSKKGLFLSVLRGIKLIVWGFALNIGLNLNLFYHIYNGTFQISPLEYLFGVDILFLAGLSVIFIASSA